MDLGIRLPPNKSGRDIWREQTTWRQVNVVFWAWIPLSATIDLVLSVRRERDFCTNLFHRAARLIAPQVIT